MFHYYEEDHPHLSDMVNVLLASGCVTIVAPNIYRMTEDFATYLFDRWV